MKSWVQKDFLSAAVVRCYHWLAGLSGLKVENWPSQTEEKVRQASYLALALFSILFPVSMLAGRIIVNHDEWTTSNTGYASAGAANAGTFVENVAAFMNVAGGPGNFLVYSANFSFNQSNFLATMAGAGHTVTQDTTGATPFNLPTLSAFDGIFLAGNGFSKDDQVLTDYVNAGGSVYISAGTGLGGPAAEAALWNGFLDDFGLAFVGTSYNGCCGNDPVTGTHAILNGVATLYYNNGNTVVLTGGNPNASIIEVGPTGQGLLGVFDATVPEPGTFVLMAAGVVAAALLRRRRAV
jgi:hypothetical protein